MKLEHSYSIRGQLMVQIIYLDKRQQIVIVILVHHQQSVAHHMQSHRELLSALYCSHYISMIFRILQNRGFEINLFADNANLFYKHESLQQLQENINAEVINILIIFSSI